MKKAPEFNSTNLWFNGFDLADAPALAAILDEPEVTKNISADASSPELSLASAKKRIGWHNASWATKGYGVWAVRSGDAKKTPGKSLLGWCEFAEPDIGVDPEILYGFTPKVWGQGLSTEAARAAIDWLFSNTREAGVSAIIFRRLNRASVHIVQNLA